jgi:phosphoribosylaminoimidazolecarboxamide formyltransferase/IMP cyclohydrolase
MSKINRALISVTDKQGVAALARGLADLGVEILSTGGTAKMIQEAGVSVVQVQDFTGFPEMLDGRVKTLHPKIHGGLLGRRDLPAHREAMATHDIGPIDLVAVNLYAFEQVTAAGADLAEAIENIDIGGPAMIRSAAKNHADVTVVVDPEDYDAVLAELRNNGGVVSRETNFRLAQKAFALTARYDGAIADHLGSYGSDGQRRAYGDVLHLQFRKIQDLRYGENPHQTAAFYGERQAAGGARDSIAEPCVTGARQLQGKELSFNNIVDANAAFELVKEFNETCAVAIKHTNPCGVATSRTALADAFRTARACDPVSIFGGIVAFNREVDADTARELSELFLEIVIAPAFSADALAIFQSTPRLKNVRVLEVPMPAAYEARGRDLKRVVGGLLVQDRDLGVARAAEAKIVTKRRPTPDELVALDFAWRVCKHVKSNAIVFARRDQVIGVGAGQMSRVDAARLAVMRAETNDLKTQGSVVASDAFFPFRDGLDVAAEAGATAVIQPGGSMRDEEVVKAADEHGLAMVFTGMRHFRH